MRLAAGIALALAAAAPASAADTVARGRLDAGPVVTGDGIAWGGRTASGAVRLLTLRPGGRPVVRRRWARSRDARTRRAVTAIAADGARGAALIVTCSNTGGYLNSPCSSRTFAGPLADLRGPRLPERVSTSCRGRSRNPSEVAMGGGWTASIVHHGCPGLGIESAVGTRIVAHRGGVARTVRTGAASGLRLAGRYMAWRSGRGATLYDLQAGRVARRLGSVGSLDVQADGTLALGRRRRGGEVCVTVLRRTGREREIECFQGTEVAAAQGGGGGASAPELAISGGRVLYDRLGAELVLARPGGRRDVLATFTPERVRTGALDLGPRTATWARRARRFPPGPGGMPGAPVDAGKPRLVLRRL